MNKERGVTIAHVGYNEVMAQTIIHRLSQNDIDVIVVGDKPQTEKDILRMQLDEQISKQAIELKQLHYEQDFSFNQKRRVTAKKPYWKNGKLKYK